MDSNSQLSVGFNEINELIWQLAAAQSCFIFQTSLRFHFFLTATTESICCSGQFKSETMSWEQERKKGYGKGRDFCHGNKITKPQEKWNLKAAGDLHQKNKKRKKKRKKEKEHTNQFLSVFLSGSANITLFSSIKHWLAIPKNLCFKVLNHMLHYFSENTKKSTLIQLYYFWCYIANEY